MRINSYLDEEDDTRVIELYGKLDTVSAPFLREEIANLPDDTNSIIIDMRDIEYLSSAGIRELLVCKKRFKDALIRIVNVSSEVADIFELTGFEKLFGVERLREDTPAKGAALDTPYYVNLSLAGFLKEKTAHDPDKIICITQDGSYTWRDLDSASERVAYELAALGIGRKSRVGLCGVNSINWIVTFYAIQKLGAMALLVNPGQSADEIARTAVISDMTHLCYGEITSMEDEEAFLNRILDNPECMIAEFYSFRNSRNLMDRSQDASSDALRVELPAMQTDDPCIMIFTSGSTGIPKGVILSSYNVLNAAYNNHHDQDLKDTDKTCLILPLFHIFGLVAGLFANGIAGSALVIPPDIRTGTLLKTIKEEQCTHFHSVPTMLLALINNKEFDPEAASSLRCTIISGAAATESQIKLFKEKFPNDHFLSSYGLSEMAPVSITEYDDSDDHVLHTVGHPVKNIDIRICDPATGKVSPAGSEGEIQVQGYNLMMGYYKIPFEDQAIDGEGWLHTGDLGYIREDGYLTMSGRLKELIIRGGENIMPGEVEAALSGLDVIENVKVIGVPSDFFGEEVCACIKIKEGQSFDEEKVKAELSGMLAKFKIPSKYVIYDELPTLGSGKIDVAALKKELC